MKIIAVASQKGGSGKSTISIHLAVEAQQNRLKTLLIDLDPHSQTSREFGRQRESNEPLIISDDGLKIEQILSVARDDDYDFIVIDLPPYVDKIASHVSRLSDLTIVPCRPSFADVRTLVRSLQQIDEPSLVVLNAGLPGNGPFEASRTIEVRRLLEENEISVAPFSISQRVALSDSLTEGKGISEYEHQSKAVTEIKKMFKYVNNLLRK